MSKPWEEKISDERTADTIPTFILFCEDKISEPVYFKFFETELIKVNTVPNQKSGMKNVIKAITKCKSDGLLEYKNGELQKVDDGVHIWCVFDRDLSDGNTEQEQNTSFNQAIWLAKSNGLNVAWSNDAFELWILLHYQDIDPESPENKNRATYYNLLTEIYTHHSAPNEFLAKALIHSSFSYKKDLKSDKNFRNIVREDITQNTDIAIERAKVLETFHSAPAKPDHEKSPCTTIHHLVESLITLGKKNYHTVS